MEAMRPSATSCLLAVLLACGGDAGDGGGGDPGAGAADGSTTVSDGAPSNLTRPQAYARPAPYSRLVLELDAVPGTEPRARSSDAVVATLDELLDKPGGIEVVRDADIASRGADHAWTNQELFELAEETFDLAAGADTVKIHVLTVDGHSARDDEGPGVILGIAWSNRHLVLFHDTIEDVCDGGLGPTLGAELCAAAEESIWTHELGHVIGLVNTGAPMVEDHEDPDHRGHDHDDGCVMYWAYEGAGLIDVLAERVVGGNSAALEFDDACRADIAALQD